MGKLKFCLEHAVFHSLPTVTHKVEFPIHFPPKEEGLCQVGGGCHVIYNFSSFIFIMIFQGMEGGQDEGHSFRLPPL